MENSGRAKMNLILLIVLNSVGRLSLIVHSIFLVVKVQSLSSFKRLNSQQSHNNYIFFTLIFSFLIVVDIVRSILTTPLLESKWYSRSIIFFILNELPLIWMLELEKYDLKRAEKRAQQPAEIANKIDSIELWCQSFYMVIIVSRLLIPKRHCSLEQMSSLGMLLLGTASDLQEFQAEMNDLFDEDQKDKEKLSSTFILLLVTWSWSISLLAINLDRCETSQPNWITTRSFVDNLVQNFYWKVGINLFLNDIPYFIVRLILVITVHGSFYSSSVFIIKNLIGIIVGMSRLWLFWHESLKSI